MEITDHFSRLKHLLDLEAEAEKEEALRLMQRHTPEGAEATGNTLINLVIREQDAGMGGRVLLTLGKKNENLPLPWTRLGTGAPVILSENGQSGGWRGIVSRLSHNTIQVAFPDWPEPGTDRPVFRLDRAADEVARKRQRQGLDRARTARDSRLAMLRDVLLGIQPPQFHTIPPPEPVDLTLNASQHAAVHFALSAEDVAIIHGPPGTGKTTTLVELIRQITRRGERVLAVAPSNLAVDNLLEKLVAAGEKAIRLGHPARVLPELREHTLDILVETHPDLRLSQKMMREAYALRNQASKFTRAKPQPGARQAMRQEARQLITDARKIEDQVIERILDSATVICATTTGLDQNLLGRRFYEWCIMDEASQSTEPGAWIPLQFAHRLVLAGDHFQLPPTVISPEAAAAGFNVSLLERLIRELGGHIARRLDVQYRMHTDIMSFSSAEFYENSLVPHESVAFHLLQDLPDAVKNHLTSVPVDFIDTAGASYDEEPEPEGESRLNPLEARLVMHKVQELLDSGIQPEGIAVISPYAAQVRLLRERLKQPAIEIDSVDGFQGREKEAVIVTLVRSNRDNDIGFLADIRRMNVALTRARRKLIVIGDSATITVHPFYQRLVEYFDSIGAYRSVWEEPLD
jgi:ATP-dependent RNA/DNA helicase IGHMBP2